MDATLRERLQSFLRPHYQDLDGASRSDDAERIGAIARRLTAPSRELELLILFHPLGSWLEKLGNLSRVLLAVGGVNENELRRTAASIRRLDAPESEAERANLGTWGGGFQEPWRYRACRRTGGPPVGCSDQP